MSVPAKRSSSALNGPQTARLWVQPAADRPGLALGARDRERHNPLQALLGRMLDLPTPEDLRAERVRLGLTQEALAERADVSQSLVARVELGEVDPSYSTLKAIVAALNRADRRQRTLEEVMSGSIVGVAPETPIADAVDEMREHGYSQLPVIDDGVPVGSVSEEQIVHALAEDEPDQVAEQPVRELMAAPFPALDPDEPVDVALRMLEDRDALLVVEGGQAIGVLTKADLLGTLEG